MAPNAILSSKYTESYYSVIMNDFMAGCQSVHARASTWIAACFGDDVQSMCLGEQTRKRPSCASAGALKVNLGKLDACGEEQRWTEGNSGRDEGSYKGPCDGPMQKRASWTEIGVSASSGDVAPHPADYDQMGEEYHGEPQPQRAGRPGKSAADGVESVESDQRTAPDGEARREPP
jgi:hypothetical protein